MNDELIKRIDERFVSLNEVPVRDVRLTREEWTQIRTTVLNCRAALSQSEPVRYVPMTDAVLFQNIERLLEVSKHSSEMDYIGEDNPWQDARDVISRAIAQGAKLEVME